MVASCGLELSGSLTKAGGPPTHRQFERYNGSPQHPPAPVFYHFILVRILARKSLLGIPRILSLYQHLIRSSSF